MSIDSQIDRVTRFWKDRAEPKLVLIMAMTAWALVGCLPEPAKAKPSPTDDEQKHPTPTYAAPINAEVSQAQNPVIIKPEATQIAKPEATATIQQPETTGSGGPYPEAMLKDPGVQAKAKAVQDLFTYYARSQEKPFAEQVIGKGRVQFIYFVDEKAPTDWSKVDVGFETYGENGENHKYIIAANVGKAKYDVPAQPTGNYSRDAAFGEVEVTPGSREGAKVIKYDGKIVRATGSAAKSDLVAWQEVQYNSQTHKWVWGESNMVQGWKDAITKWQDAKGIGDLPKEWTTFRNGQGELPTAQGAVLEKFTGQWAKWNELARTSGIKDASVRMVSGRTDLYMADKNGQLYVPLYRNLQEKTGLENASAVVLAKTLPGVTQRWNPDISMVEYIDAQGNTEMSATAIYVNMRSGIALATEGYSASEQKKIQLTTFAGEQNWLSWAGLERLTAGQRAELRNAMKWLDEKHPLLNFLKGTKNLGIIGNTNTANAPKDGVMIGKLNLDGTGYIKPVLEHEMIHKGQTGECGLEWEIGDGTIPENILTMSDEEFLAGIRDGRFGAYHASLRGEAEVGSHSGINWRYLITHGKDKDIVPTCKE